MSREESPASFGGIALDALEAARMAQAKADQVERDIDGHEAICAERYSNINEKIGTLFRLMAWGGSLALTLVLALLAFLAKAQFDSITELKSAAVQRASIERRMDAPPPQVIIQQSPTGEQPITGASIATQPKP